MKAASRLRPEAGESHLARAQSSLLRLSRLRRGVGGARVARRQCQITSDLRATGFIFAGAAREEGVHNLKARMELDPRNFFTLQQIGLSYYIKGRYNEQIGVLDRALSVKPDDFETRVARQLVAGLDWKADPGPVHRIIDEIRVLSIQMRFPALRISWVLCAFAERDLCCSRNGASARLATTLWGEITATSPNVSLSAKDCSLGSSTMKQKHALHLLKQKRGAAETRAGGPELCSSDLYSRTD